MWQAGEGGARVANTHLRASRCSREASTSIWPSWLKCRVSMVVLRLSTVLSGLPARWREKEGCSGGRERGKTTAMRSRGGTAAQHKSHNVQE